MTEIRVDINMTQETKALLDQAVKEEAEEDNRNDRPPRSRSAILEAILRRSLHQRQKGGP